MQIDMWIQDRRLMFYWFHKNICMCCSAEADYIKLRLNWTEGRKRCCSSTLIFPIDLLGDGVRLQARVKMLYHQPKHLCQAAVDSTTWSGPRCAAGSDLEGSSLCSVGSAPGLSPPVGVCQLSGTRSLSAACHAASLPPPASAPVDRGCGEAPPPGGSTWVHMRVQLQGPLFLSCLAVASPTPAYRSESTARITSATDELTKCIVC